MSRCSANASNETASSYTNIIKDNNMNITCKAKNMSAIKS